VNSTVQQTTRRRPLCHSETLRDLALAHTILGARHGALPLTAFEVASMILLATPATLRGRVLLRPVTTCVVTVVSICEAGSHR
jgi:hypothetical protein